MKIQQITTRYIIKTLPVILIIIITMGCRREQYKPESPDKYSGSNFADVFEAFWNGMNNNYLFWSIDTTNWDNVYRKYKPLFKELDKINDSTQVMTAYRYFKDMTAGLVDGHYSIRFTKSLLKDSSIRPLDNKWRQSPRYHNEIPAEHFFRTIYNKYLDAGSILGIREEQGQAFYVISGTINQDILYLRFNAFALNSFYSSQDVEDSKVKIAIQHFFDNLKRPNLKGLIIDVRSNGGGDLSDLDFLVGRLIDKPLHYNDIRTKNGDGRLDYTPWVKGFVTPQKDARSFTAPIVMLVDLHSVSMSEITTMAIKALPNGSIVGERTWGGQGALTSNENNNAGQFKTEFFSVVYTASYQSRYIDGKTYEGVGFPPDVEVKYDRTAIIAGKDPQLEAAIKVITR